MATGAAAAGRRAAVRRGPATAQRRPAACGLGLPGGTSWVQQPAGGGRPAGGGVPAAAVRVQVLQERCGVRHERVSALPGGAAGAQWRRLVAYRAWAESWHGSSGAAAGGGQHGCGARVGVLQRVSVSLTQPEGSTATALCRRRCTASRPHCLPAIRRLAVCTPWLLVSSHYPSQSHS